MKIVSDLLTIFYFLMGYLSNLKNQINIIAACIGAPEIYNSQKFSFANIRVLKYIEVIADHNRMLDKIMIANLLIYFLMNTMIETHEIGKK